MFMSLLMSIPHDFLVYMSILMTILDIAWYAPETDFHIFVRGGWINIWGGAAACFGRGVVATPGKAKEKV
jgi:uncharacterized membrane protein